MSVDINYDPKLDTVLGKMNDVFKKHNHHLLFKVRGKMKELEKCVMEARDEVLFQFLE